MANENEIRLEEPSLGQLFGEMTNELGTLVRKEVELAKVETKAEIAKATSAGKQIGAAALLGYLSIVFASLGVAFLLDAVMPRTLAFLLVAGAFGATAYVLGRNGAQEMKNVNPVPEQTAQTVKEDVQWAKKRNS